MNDITNMPEDALQGYLKEKNFELTSDEKIKLGRRVLRAANQVIPAGKENEVCIRSAEEKLKTSREAYVNDLETRSKFVKSVLEHEEEPMPAPNPFEGIENFLQKAQENPSSILEALYSVVSPHIKDDKVKTSLNAILQNKPLARALSTKYLTNASMQVQLATDPTHTSPMKTALQLVSPRLSRLEQEDAGKSVLEAAKNGLNEVVALVQGHMGESEGIADTSHDAYIILVNYLSRLGDLREEPARTRILKELSRLDTALNALETKLFGARPGIYFACSEAVKNIEVAIKPTTLTSEQKETLEKSVRAFLETAVDKGITKKSLEFLALTQQFLKNPKMSADEFTQKAAPIIKDTAALLNKTFLG